ncbi:hypothetical protein, partial [Klebsiella pneumoniae]|uniref:hypothetical protein n=1 Tax=Klebsiella pneumoniae TaxID=573 RepID=UPI0025A26419
QWPLDRLAGMTGGLSFRVDVGASGVFDRMSRELSAYYRLGIEQDITDNDGRTRPMKVEVTRPGAKVRAR